MSERVIPEKMKPHLEQALNLLINYGVLVLEDEIKTGRLGFSSSYNQFGRMNPNTKYQIFSMEVSNEPSNSTTSQKTT